MKVCMRFPPLSIIEKPTRHEDRYGVLTSGSTIVVSTHPSSVANAFDALIHVLWAY